jgi:hypothetical protein
MADIGAALPLTPRSRHSPRADAAAELGGKRNSLGGHSVGAQSTKRAKSVQRT